MVVKGHWQIGDLQTTAHNYWFSQQTTTRLHHPCCFIHEFRFIVAIHCVYNDWRTNFSTHTINTTTLQTEAMSCLAPAAMLFV